MTIAKLKSRTEFGDFQTPAGLAETVCVLLRNTGVRPAAVLEPTCGQGSFLLAAAKAFPEAAHLLGFDVNRAYLRQAKATFQKLADQPAEFAYGDFFSTDWPTVLAALPDPLLVVGNPPWVTNTELGKLSSSNLPRKANVDKHRGIDALTGKSNFDISEWILRTLTDLLCKRQATLAMLCKTGVARKILAHVWKNRTPIESAKIHEFDAAATFGVSVDACLLTVQFSGNVGSDDCPIFGSLADDQPRSRIGFRAGRLMADVTAFDELEYLQGRGGPRWRSGVKHDCTKVMELTREGNRFRNGLGELVELEQEYLYPTLKTSQVANGKTDSPCRWMLITQKLIGDETDAIRERAPKTWRYLQAHADALDRRASSIYRNRPRFSVFGVGDYTFAKWKVAISGFYKKLQFAEIGTFEGKPIVLDDATYFLPCKSQREAKRLATLLNSDVVKKFYNALIFWDSKRPITVDVLKQLNLESLSGKSRAESGMLF